jgi:hypothetical protein
MPVLATTNITLPKQIASGMWSKTVTGSVVAQLSGSEPMKFGSVDIMTFSAPPRAEYVAEAANKGTTGGTFGVKTATPHKAHVTMRFNEEVQWADEDYQLGVLQTLADAGSVALARALDLGAIHGINPLSGAAIASIVAADRLNTTTNRVEVVGASTADTEFETAAGLIIAQGYTPTGVALDPKFAWTLSTARYADGRKKFPELGLGTNVSNFQGITTATSTTVSGLPEATDTKLRALIGDWSLLRWGVQKNVPVELIKYGDPDGQGDLKRQNQIAMRLEIVYGWAVLDLLGFAALNDLV